MARNCLLLSVASVFILLAPLQQICAHLASDGRALLEFAAAVPHLRKLNWKSSLPVCSSWVGITCNDEGERVTEVHLPAVGLYGPIPAKSIGKLSALRILSLRSNYLNGSIPSDILEIRSLRSLYLQHNRFSGDIPRAFSPQLGVIDLSFNSFTGEIPSTISNLTQLSVLNLQNNSFHGNIPNLNLPRLKSLNLSYNVLNGSIPQSFQKFPKTSFLGNSHLCGPPLNQCSEIAPSPSPLPPVAPNSTYSKKLTTGAITAIAIGGSSIVLVLVLLILFCCLKKKNRVTTGVKKKGSLTGKNEKSEDFGSGVQASEKNKLVFFGGCSYSFDLEDLLRASAEVLGKGSYGTTYKAVLDEGTMFAVKRLKEVGAGKKEFEQQMEMVGKVGQHRNIVPLRAYYFSKDEKLLVYDYLSATSLSAALHGNRGIGRTPLDWDTRLKISLGAARGISYIHSESGTKLTHGNIKASNILLSRDLDGCITEFGLTPLMNVLPLKSRGAGYRAPEVIETRRGNQKSDVYSFGVVLLEMLTGKSPLYSSGHDEVVDLPRWVRSVVREEWTAEVFDTELMRHHNVEEEMVQMLQIALSCVAKIPDNRPIMDEVVRMIEEIRLSDMDNRPSSEDNRSKDSNVQTPSHELN